MPSSRADCAQSYCYYQVVRVDDPAVLSLFWRAAGLKYLGSKAGKNMVGKTEKRGPFHDDR